MWPTLPWQSPERFHRTIVTPPRPRLALSKSWRRHMAGAWAPCTRMHCKPAHGATLPRRCSRWKLATTCSPSRSKGDLLTRVAQPDTPPFTRQSPASLRKSLSVDTFADDSCSGFPSQNGWRAQVEVVREGTSFYDLIVHRSGLRDGKNINETQLEISTAGHMYLPTCIDNGRDDDRKATRPGRQ